MEAPVNLSVSGVLWCRRKLPNLALFVQLLTWLSSVYAFTGTELVGMTVGEAKHPRLAMPRAVKMTFFRIVFFYVLSVFFLGMVVPSNSTDLVFATKSSASAAASPFVVTIRLAKIHGLDHVINGCLIVFVFSASTSGMM